MMVVEFNSLMQMALRVLWLALAVAVFFYFFSSVRLLSFLFLHSSKPLFKTNI